MKKRDRPPVPPSTLAEDLARLREAWLDFAYLLLKPLIPLVLRLGLELAPWVAERQIRERHR